jgi:hypothetical protein
MRDGSASSKSCWDNEGAKVSLRTTLRLRMRFGEISLDAKRRSKYLGMFSRVAGMKEVHMGDPFLSVTKVNTETSQGMRTAPHGTRKQTNSNRLFRCNGWLRLGDLRRGSRSISYGDDVD